LFIIARAVMVTAATRRQAGAAIVSGGYHSNSQEGKK